MVKRSGQIYDLITIDQASKVKGATYHQLYQWVKRHDIERIKIGNTYLLKLSDLVAYQPR